jgi:hypothetical protein
MREKYVYFQKNAAATAAIGELTFTAVDKSAKGNLVSVAIPESGTESQVTVTVSGNDITCAIGTSNDMGGDNIVTAIEASAAASALVGVVSSGSTHITSAVSQTYLSGGEAGVSFPLNSIREAMDDICKAFTSSKARPFDIVIGDDRGDDIQKVSSYISDVEAITIASANS